MDSRWERRDGLQKSAGAVHLDHPKPATTRPGPSLGEVAGRGWRRSVLLLEEDREKLVK